MSGWLDALADDARRAMPAPMWTYVQAGAREEVSLREAEAAWGGYRLLPRVLRDVSGVDVSTNLLGQPVRTPIGIAPTSMQRAAHPEGERAMAEGAAAAGALHVLCSNAGYSLDAIGLQSPWWLQVYVPPEPASIVALLEEAVAAGAGALVLTADTPMPGTKHAVSDADWDGIDISWHRCNLVDPASRAWSPGLTADTIGWLTSVTGLPVVVKGVLRADDARRCVEAGAAAIYVSNHGGRQLDRAVATASALPGVVAAVGDDVEVYVDGGVRSGLDVLTALGLGARAVFVGRPALWGLGARGPSGVSAVLRQLTEELADAMTLSGCATVPDTLGVVAPRPPHPL